MELYHHTSPPFTQWVAENRLLHSKFVVVDIGCQGGEHPRWPLLGDLVEFHGFDPIREVIEALRREARPGRFYYDIGLGDEDGEREFFVHNNTFGSSFFGPHDHPQATDNPSIERGSRMVSIKRLDTLFASGALPAADYIKLDCEGFEPEVLRGGRAYLTASGPICVTSESAFTAAAIYPYGHFQALNEIVAEHRLLVFDINIIRNPTPFFHAARAAHPLLEPDPMTEIPHLDVGAPGTLDVLFCRDFVREQRHPSYYKFNFVPAGPPSADQLIKAMINFELHGLMDCAYDLALAFRPELEARLDVGKATELLLIKPPHTRNIADVHACLRMIDELRARPTASVQPSTKQSARPPFLRRLCSATAARWNRRFRRS